MSAAISVDEKIGLDIVAKRTNKFIFFKPPPTDQPSPTNFDTVHFMETYNDHSFDHKCG